MRKVLLIIVLASFFSCGGQRFSESLPQIDDGSWSPIANTDEEVEIYSSEKNGTESFNGLLPYDEEKELTPDVTEPFNELVRLMPIFPRGAQLQRCIGSTLVIFRGEQPTRRLDYLILAVCFEGESSTRIDRQLANELLIFNRILSRDADNRVLLSVPEGIINRRLARQRIGAVRNFLLQEGATPERVIEVEDSPPE
ncbi:MAG: hypothetical protein HQ536_00055 [Parcubacteria group bacterium]|nr:hypothetical protein [Parcubacteria group bacterium]